MKKFWVSIYVISLLVISTWTSSCDPNEVKKSPDPCKGKIGYSGDFLILENVGDSLVQTDTALRYNYITFRAAGIYDSYEWKIGNDARTFTGKEVRLLFTEAEGKINVTLKSRKASDSCFPEAPIEATVTKSVYVVEWVHAPILGKFLGYFKSAPTIQETIEIRYTQSVDEFGSLELFNINRGCMINPEFPDSPVWMGVSKGARAMSFEAYGAFYNGCKSPDVWLRLVDKDSIFSSFSFLNRQSQAQQPPYPKVTDEFIGKRIID
jgi:hypothetical protein